ncbi:hypothetical protein [Streptomyces sp. NPDC096012]|uniref:hypothetical protein n=1 Tax=Streptomyces sp. NPDC096012 TaxID=3155684 RepID=UPI00336A9AD5
MIRRTLKSGVLGTIAVLAFLPTATGAAPASATTSQPVPGVTVRHHHTHQDGIRLHGGHLTHRVHQPVHRFGHQVRRMHHLAPRTPAYRRAVPGTSYRLVTAGLVSHRATAGLTSHRTAYRVAATGRVVTRHARLNVRSGPGTGYRVIGHRHTRRLVALTCKTRGSSVYGNRTWYRLPHHHGYVSARYVRLNRALPWC